jgi:Fur family peroxide stress response transcriptional regulator
MDRDRYIGLKLTPQRMAIFEYLEGNRDHPSAEDIHKAIALKFPSMSLATVYNTLRTLKEKGSVRELTIDPARKRYDPDIGRHNHLICTACGKIVDIRLDYDFKLPKSVSRRFTLLGGQIELYGVCAGCRGNK